MQLGELPAHVGVWKALLFRMRRSLGGFLCLLVNRLLQGLAVTPLRRLVIRALYHRAHNCGSEGLEHW